MWSVAASLAPAVVMGTYFFGPRALLTIALCIAASVLWEYFFQKATGKKQTVSDGSAFLTGLLLGMNLPPSVSFYIPVVVPLPQSLSPLLAGSDTTSLIPLIGRGFCLFIPQTHDHME
jgi:hypothetical protein